MDDLLRWQRQAQVSRYEGSICDFGHAILSYASRRLPYRVKREFNIGELPHRDGNVRHLDIAVVQNSRVTNQALRVPFLVECKRADRFTRKNIEQLDGYMYLSMCSDDMMLNSNTARIYRDVSGDGVRHPIIVITNIELITEEDIRRLIDYVYSLLIKDYLVNQDDSWDVQICVYFESITKVLEI